MQQVPCALRVRIRCILRTHWMLPYVIIIHVYSLCVWIVTTCSVVFWQIKCWRLQGTHLSVSGERGILYLSANEQTKQFFTQTTLSSSSCWLQLHPSWLFFWFQLFSVNTLYFIDHMNLYLQSKAPFTMTFQDGNHTPILASPPVWTSLVVVGGSQRRDDFSVKPHRDFTRLCLDQCE